ncbi:MAG: hypothetical protein PWQ96_581 [Clostridia bacterium]|jgi:sporulation integral membrane protein YtvI|nr:hypothetical protein [Clostridia bacterium]
MLPVNDQEKKLLARTILILIILTIIYLLYYKILPATFAITSRVLPILMPFIIALVIAELLEPFIEFLQKLLPVNRTLAIFIALVSTLGTISVLFVILISRLVVELIKFSNTFPKYSGLIRNSLVRFAEDVEKLYITIDLPDKVIKTLEDSIVQGLELVKNMSVQVVEWSINFLSFLPGGMLLILFAVMAIFFFSKDKHLLRRTLKNILPENISSKMEIIVDELGVALIGFLRAQVILMLLTMVQTFIGLAILRVDYAVLMAIIVGVVDALPIFGPGAVFLPWIGWEFLINREFGFALALLVLYTIVSVVRQVLQPKIVGESIGMHPLEALISIYAGLKLFGVAGVIAGPIIWVLIKAGWRAKIFTR